MDVSIERLAAALETAATDTERTPRDIAAAGAGIGHLGRALLALAAAEDNTNTVAGRTFDLLVQRLGQECADLAATAPQAETRSTLLAAAVADSIGHTLPTTTVIDRRVLISRVVDALDPLTAVVADLPENTGPRERIDRIKVLAPQVQQVASRSRLNMDTHDVLHRELATRPRVAEIVHPSRHLPTALGYLRAGIAARSTMTSAEVLQISIACELVARRAEPATPVPQHLLPKDVTAGDAWLAVQATLAVIRDHRATEPESTPDLDWASLTVARAATIAPAADVAAAAQQLPEITDRLRAAVSEWPGSVRVVGPSPGSATRPRPADPNQALARVSSALDAAGTLSIALADLRGHIDPSRPADWIRHHKHAHNLEFRDAVSEAQAVTHACIRPNAFALGTKVDARGANPGDGRSANSTHGARRSRDQHAYQDTLPPGYWITTEARPGASHGYQVLYGSGRAQQFIGMRLDPTEAVHLAYQHHNRSQAQRSSPPPGLPPRQPPPRR
jgi:hypothetical protein